MASRAFSTFRSERYALDLPVAALAGIAVAFAAFAVPADVLAELIGITRLPEILPAAQPPLGTTARIALAAGGALTVFALAFLLLRWLDRFASSPAARPEPAEGPRLRKRDGHPDAPSVRPISALREFGEPASPLAVKRRPPAEPVVEEAEPVSYAPVVEPEAEPVLSIASLRSLVRDEADEPVAQREPDFQPEPEPDFRREPEPEPAFQPEPVFQREAIARHVPAESSRPPSLAELMARLERGLAERRTGESEPEVAPAPADARPAPQAFADTGDERLQSAIESLQRLAARDR